MRYLVLSDIHGGSSELEKALTYFDKYQCDYVVLLGDLLNHGPRNIVPQSYKPANVAEQLNAIKDKIISVRGNCDSEVDSMMFDFPCNSPCNYILVEGPKTDLSTIAPLPLFSDDPFPEMSKLSKDEKGVQRIFLTHGHLHQIWAKNADEAVAQRDKLGLTEYDYVFSGHTHVAGIFSLANGLTNINPGSITLPKGGTKAGFGLILEDRIEIRSLWEDELVESIALIFR